MKEIPLTRGFVALVDDEDYERVSRFKWQVRAARPDANYARTDLPMRKGRRGAQVQMHRLILGITDPRIEIDHINQDGLDNRRANLRVCSSAENARNRGIRSNNTSGIKGVRWSKWAGKWSARITVGGMEHHIGNFTDKQAAADAYARAAREFHGEFANAAIRDDSGRRSRRRVSEQKSTAPIASGATVGVEV